MTTPEATMTMTAETTTEKKRGSDFAALRREVQAANLLARRRGNYVARIFFTIAAVIATWAAFAYVGDSWYQLVVAAVLGVVFTQVAFLGHDGGHQQVYRSRRANDTLGILAGDLLVGLSYGWWVDKHNRHHSHPNHEGQDPDIGEGVLVFTTGQVAARTGMLGRFITRHQAWLFFPLLTLEGISLHVASARAMLASPARRYRRVELLLFALHVIGYLTAVLWVLSPVKALVFVSVHQAVFGFYMGCSFAPNHKGMPTVPPGLEMDFLRRQVLTSRNVRGGWFTDVLLGGLNYQVEHHLFPNMPRPSLRKAQYLVRAYCQDRQIAYTETSLFGSYAAALRHLHQLGEPLRVKTRGVA
jgi:fatty acid desaturase